MNSKNIFFSFIEVIILLQANLFAQNSAQIRGFGETWVATDALGRNLSTNMEVGSPQSDRYVGVFYLLWQGTLNLDTIIYDNSKLLHANPQHPAYGPHYAAHWWGEPEAGYYRADDPWVIRRNLQMLVNAGVDFLYLDATNAIVYWNALFALCDVSEKMRQEGIQTPNIVFFTHSSGGQTLNNIYNGFYKKFSQYSNLWFYWDGKPLILADSSDPMISFAEKNFFTFRNSWAWMNETIPDQWQWIDFYPQRYAWHVNPHIPEQISVAPASHPTLDIGKSFLNGTEPPLDQYDETPYMGDGLYFQKQWSRALQVNPRVVMVTGWNEWIAMRFIAPMDGNPNFLGKPATAAPESTFFVDNYNEEFNRDIEPMKGGYTDNYYYQLVNNIRKYKGCESMPFTNGMHSIVINGDFSNWTDVQPIFYDAQGDTQHRNWYDAVNKHIYSNVTGRNDIVESRVAYDSNNVYFYVKTDTALTSFTDKNWMLLFIDSDTNHTTGWEGYDYVVNLNVKSDSVTTLASWNKQDSSWNEVSSLKYCYNGNQMEIQVPRNLINQNGKNISFYFHWADNIQKLNDITEFFIDGDSAPDRRFNYWFTTQETSGVKDTYLHSQNLSLLQNYPNPFNPTTQIKYSIPKSGMVSLKVYDLLGKVVSTLINKEQDAGSYIVNFDASGLASGIYIYRIQSGCFSVAKKMIVLK